MLQIFQSSPLPSLIVLPDAPLFKIVDANEAYCTVTNMTREDLIGRGIFEAFPDNPNLRDVDGVSNLRASLMKVIRTEKNHRMAQQQYDINDQSTGQWIEKYWEPENIPMFDETHKLTHIMHTVQDVTTVVLAARAEKRSQDKYKSVVDNSFSAIFITRPDGTILEANRAACELFGYSEDEFRKIGRDGVFDQNDGLKQKVAERSAKGQLRGELTGIKKSGERFPLEFYSAIFHDENGHAIASTIINDISDRKRNEEEIYQLVNNTEESFVLLDSDLNIRSFNKQFYELYKHYFSVEVRKGTSILEYASRESVDHVKEIYNRVLRGESVTKELTLSADNDIKKIYKLKYKPVRDKQGNTIGTFVSASNITRTRAFERDLLESRNSIQKILDQSLDIICTIDREGRFISVSAAARHILGYEPSELTGKAYMDLVLAEDREKTVQSATEIMHGIEKTNFENRYLRKDGSVVPIVWSARWDEEDKIMYAIARDASEQKRAAGQLRQSEQRFRSLVQDGSDLIAILDPEGNYQYVSPTSATVLDIEPEEFIGKNAFSFIHPEDCERVMANFGKLATEKRIYLDPFRFLHKNGTWRWVETTVTNLTNDPAVMGIVANSRDVTNRITVDEAIRIQHQNYRDLFNNAPAFICILKGRDHVFQMANPDYEKLIGRSNLIGKTVKEVLPELEGHGFFELLDQVFSSGEAYHGNEVPLEVHHQEKGHIKLYVNFSYQAYRNIENQIEGIFVFGTDVTFQVEARMAVHQSNERYKYVTQATSDAIWDWDLVSGTLYWGEGFKILFGYHPSTLPTDITSWTRHIHRDDLDRVLAQINKAIDGSETNWIDEYRYLKADGSYAFVLDRGFVIRDRNGKAVRMVGAMQDTTKHKNEEIKKNLVTDTSVLFSQQLPFHQILQNVLKKLMTFEQFDLAEVWLVSTDKNRLELAAKLTSVEQLESFYFETEGTKSFEPDQGLPGKTWKSKSIEHWVNPAGMETFVRRDAAQRIGLRTMTGLPVIFSNEVIGVLLLGHVYSPGKASSLQPLLYSGFTEHLGAEIKRKQLEEELAQIFHAAPDIICIVGTDGYFKKINPAACEMLEYAEAELLAQPWKQLIHPDDHHLTFNSKSSHQHGRSTFHFENRVITRSGKTKWFLWSYSTDTETGVIYALAQEITEKKNLQNLLDSATSLARIGSWELVLNDHENDNMYWSPMTREILETDPDYNPSLTGGFEFYTEEFKPVIAAAVRNLITDGEIFDLELCLITARNNIRWVRCIGESERMDGKCTKIFGSFQDIHQRKVAELSLIETNKKVLSTLESIQDGFYALDSNWVITYWNKEAERLLMTKREDVIGQDLWQKFPDLRSLRFYPEYHRALTEKMSVRFEEYFPPRDNWYDIAVFPSEDGLTVYFKDITSRKQSEQKMKELNEDLVRHAKELAASNAELEQFAYVASHDLQEPLRMVSSFLTQLEKNYKPLLDDRGKQYIHFAVDGAQRMRQIILDLLEFSRVGRMMAENESIDLNALIHEILLLYKAQIEEKEASIQVSRLPVVIAPRSPVRQIFQNLLSNALKYQPGGRKPVIRIDVKDEETSWVFSISDNGIGIHPDYHDKIFLLFQRLHTRTDYPGIGMGLPICKKIIENLGGRIWVESQEEAGSIFYFSIPRNSSS
ncbi:MAG: PAS domain S-box protein [Chryseosolibacter sp.]